MKAMWTESVRPLLMERQNCTLHSVTLRVLGGESDIEYKVRDLLENPNPTAAIYCKTGECEIRITARARSDEDGEKICRAYAKSSMICWAMRCMMKMWLVWKKRWSIPCRKRG